MEKTLLVEGMMCNHCKAKVEKTLKAIDGVDEAIVDLAAKTATVTLSADVPDEALVAAVEGKGFKPTQVI